MYGICEPPSKEAGAWAKKTGHEFVRLYSEPKNFYVYRDLQQVGLWTGIYYTTFDPVKRTYGSVGLPPWAPEAKVDETTRPKIPNFGVTVDKIAGSPEYSVNGRPCTRSEAMAATDEIPDESKLFRVVAVGAKDFLDKVSGDWETAKSLHSAALLQCYEPEYWWAKENNLPAGSLTVCDPTGKAVHFQQGYDLGDWKLFGGAFDPSKTPDLRADPIAAFFKKAVEWVKANQLISLLIAGAAGYWWFYKREQ